MTKFHDTLSRRDFMKALGMGAAGVGTAAVAAPLFNDLDDMASSGETYDIKRAWWVKKLDLGKFTTEIDWNALEGHENNYILNSAPGMIYSFGANGMTELFAKGAANLEAAARKGGGGNKVEDYALSAASMPTMNFTVSTYNLQFPSYASQPGLQKYSGSPEEASKIVRAAATYLGAASVGFAVLEGNEKKIFNKVHSEGRPIVFEDVEHPYDNAEKIVVPNNRTLYAIGIGVLFPKELFRHEYTEYGAGMTRFAANSERYRRWQAIYLAMQKFINYLGYEAFGYPHPYRGLIPAGGDAIIVGMAEGARSSNNFISPEHGMCQGYYSIITDLPVAPTNPIDAGIRRFCHTCKKCAIACPTGAIDMSDEPRWELDDPNLYIIKDRPAKFMAPGKLNFTYDAYACQQGGAGKSGSNGGNCCNCMGTCTFNTNAGAGIHDLIKPLVATTGLLNGFLWRADDFYGFGLTSDEKKSDWWDMDLPVYGVSTTVTCTDGGYRKYGS